jgi:3-methyl-2-oxobutanoate hydroxymethyltransferase
MPTKAVSHLRAALHFSSFTLGARHISPIKTFIAQYSSHSPMGSTTASTRKKVTIQTIQNLYKKNEPITVLTASDFPSGHVADSAGMEIVLVGDSLAMVAMGMEDTNEVTMDEMLLHCRSVSRAVKSAFTVSTYSKYMNISSNPQTRSQTCPWAHTRYHPNKRSHPRSGW